MHIDWKNQLDQEKVVKEFSTINYLDINQNGNELLVTSSSKISLYSVNNLNNRKTFNSNGATQVYGANFRKTDYKLITSSTKDGKINIFDINNNRPLRTIEGDEKTKHKNAVKKSIFYGVSNIISFSDDKHIKFWDLGVGSLINDVGYNENDKTTPHLDYIRCGYCAPEHNLIVSGSYDHTVKIWDPRSNSTEPLHNYDHGAQVESVVMKNSLIVSAGDKIVKVYDLISGKIILCLKNIHSKSITCLVNYDNNFLTSSIDGHLKIFDTNFKLKHSINYTSAQITSLCVNNKALVVGSNDGLINVKKIKEKIIINDQSSKKRFKTDLNEFIDKTRYENNIIVKKEKKIKQIKKYEKLLNEFRYTDALELMIKSKDIDSVIDLLQELLRRDGLRVALAGKKERNLDYFINFICINIKKTKYARVLLEVAIILVEVYIPVIHRSPSYQNSFKKLINVLKDEINLLENLHILRSQMDMIANIVV